MSAVVTAAAAAAASAAAMAALMAVMAVEAGREGRGGWMSKGGCPCSPPGGVEMIIVPAGHEITTIQTCVSKA